MFSKKKLRKQKGERKTADFGMLQKTKHFTGYDCC